MAIKLENAHNLHRRITELINETELDQDWLDDNEVLCKITRYNVDLLRDGILDLVIEFVNENYMLYP